MPKPSNPIPVQPERLRAFATGKPVGVDRKAKVLRGYVVAQLGPFKSFGRGEFDRLALEQIVELGNAGPHGLKSHFQHETLSDDGLGKLLGRSRNFRLDTATVMRDGKRLTVEAVRADLHFSDAAFNAPAGNLGQYVMDLADEDPDALSSSLVLNKTEAWRLNEDGTPQIDEDGEELPPLWRVEKLWASDIVDTGDAVDGLLSVQLDIDRLPDAAVRRGAELLDRAFAGQPREVIEARCKAWLSRYLAHRFGPEEESPHPQPPPRIGEGAGGEVRGPAGDVPVAIRRKLLNLKAKQLALYTAGGR